MASSKQFGGIDEGSEKQHEQKQAGSTELGRSMGRMADAIQEAGGQASTTVKEARQLAEEKAEALMSWIKERPLTSVLIGAAVGYLFGRMARR
jgi:ElaB/YqjD/DUF883 family membrane-anchored ribosome-binding protein